MTETLLHKVLLWEEAGATRYDSWNMCGVIRPSKSTAGLGTPTYDSKHSIILEPRNWFEDVLLRAFAKVLIAASNAGQQRLRSIDNDHIYHFLTTSLPQVGQRTFIMHPEELEAQKKNQQFRGPCYALKYLPKRAIIAMGPPELAGLMAVSTKGAHPLCLDYFINPMYVTGCQRTGKVT